MANKKDFTTDAASVFVEKMITPTDTAPAARRTPTPAPAQKKVKPAEVKVTFMLRDDMDVKLRYICFAEHMKQKDVLTDALGAYFAAYEKKHGKI